MNYQKAILSLRPTASFSFADSDDLSTLTWLSEDVERPTDEEITTAAAATEYAIDRLKAYPSIQEQLDMQYWDSVNGTTTWADAIAAVKAEYPKPE
jgi:hypothetical protein